jgi:hypothetical protein
VPAHRSRTEHWRDCLKQIHERGGAIEITVDRGQSVEEAAADNGADLVWRCRIVSLTDSTIVVEPPAAFGATLTLQPGVKLIGGMTIGQNRWMFHTSTMGYAKNASSFSIDAPLVLQMPETVERCSRRSFFRISTANLNLASVQCWPLLDPSTVAAAEAANRAEINDLLAARSAAQPSADPERILLPEVGPMFKASLLNLSGGGLGLMLNHSDSGALSSRPYLWMRVDVRPGVPAPIAMTARVAHTHVDSAQNLYAGMAFDFSHNPTHKPFVIDMMARYIDQLQKQQRAGKSQAA